LDCAITGRQMALLVHRHTGDERPLTRLLSLVLPDVVVSMGGLSSPDLSSINNSTAKLIDIRKVLPHRLIGSMQVDYLIGRGHRKLGFAFPGDAALHPIASERLAGMQAESTARRLAEPLVITIDLDGSDAASAVKEWLAAGVTAICAHNDAVAMILLAEAAKRGLTRDDFAIIGVDNAPIAQYGLTTIAINVAQFSNRVVEAVISILDDRAVPESDGASLLELVVRESA
jgi:DNA-binding LacI/PurR family transcriptional regulator